MTWTTTKDLPCGRLRVVAYTPYRGVSWSAQWQETKKAGLARQLRAIVKALSLAVADMTEKLAEAERRAEIARRKWLEEEQKWRREEDRKNAPVDRG